MNILRVEMYSEGSRFLEKVYSREIGVSPAIEKTVKSVLENVRKKGDTALIDYTRKFDGFNLNRSNIRVTKKEIKAAASKTDRKFLGALHKSIDN
ncbi:MAG: histidinol dehydrogenase, partial [Fibrobacterota bacterium]